MDIDASNWNEDDNSNTTAAPDGAPEGMAPSGVNNVLRAIMGALKRRRNWGAPKTTGGSATAYTLSYTVAPGALVDGMTHLVQFNAANGNAPTLNVNTLGAIPIHYYSAGAWRAAPAALWDADEIFRVAYHSSSGTYRLLHFRNRTGELVPYAGSTAPAGSLLCCGQAISRTAYAGLFAALSTTYGVGDGSTTFNLPDLRGRVAAGKDNMGGSAASRLTGATMSPDGNTLGAAGGQQTETTTGAGSASVNGSTSGPNNVAGSNTGGGDFATALHGHNISFDAPVSIVTAAVTNVQPTTILNYVIRI